MDGWKTKRTEYRDFDEYLTEKEQALEDFFIYSCEMYNIHGHPDSYKCACCMAELIETEDGVILMIHNEIVKH